jgi:hypothetical protein
VLELCRPIVRESPFEAAANQPSAVGGAARAGERCASCQIGDGEAIGTDPTAASFGVE